MRVRSRFAPSPTGHIHIGSVRTALFNWLFARKHSGDFILRSEDTDPLRSRREYEEAIMEDLAWLGLAWDEGPDVGGPKGPYRQSERLPIYRGYAERLLAEGLAYRCYCSEARLDSLKKAQLERGLPPRYDGRCRSLKEIPPGITPALRFKIPEKREKISFEDGLRGPLSFETSAFGDFIITGSDGLPSYNFAVVVDDALMEISHVIRGEDHLPNTPRQVLLYEALGFTPPEFIHLPLVITPEKKPLGKRYEGSIVRTLREEGFLATAVLNAASRLGWSPGEEILTLKEMTDAFSIEKLSKSPSTFDIKRLKVFNKEVMESLDIEELIQLLRTDAARGIDLKEAVLATRPNASTLKELKEVLKSLTGPVPFTEEALSVLREPSARAVLTTFLEEVEKVDEGNETTYNSVISAVKEKTGERGNRLFLPIRCALTGVTTGIELIKVFTIIRKKEVTERVRKSLSV